MCFCKSRRGEKTRELRIILIRFEKPAARLTGGLTGLPFTSPALSILCVVYFDIPAFLALSAEPSGTCSLIKCNNS